MVEIMRALGELKTLGLGCEYMHMKGRPYEILSTKSMHI